MNILIAGANGFVGSALIPKLLEEGHKITALARKIDPSMKKEGVTWIEGDLLNPSSLPKIGKIDKAFYLVHGLKESHGNFEYYESLAAVNFLNWIRTHVAGIVYLGALVPEGVTLSPHLRSRELSGSILAASGLPVLEFRASIILGEGSLSFEMIKALSERFPIRPEMNLLSQTCQPLALNDLLKYLVAAVDYIHVGHKILEVGGPDVASYGDLLDIYSELAGLKRKRIKIPEVELKVLLKLLEYAIPEHAEVGKKLTESMEHSTVLNNDAAKKVFPKIRPKSIRVAMDLARTNSTTHYPPVWEKDFLKSLLSDKLLVQSGFLSPDFLKNIEKITKLRDMLSRSK